MDSSWAISNPKRLCCESAALNMSANLENSAMVTGLEKVSFHQSQIRAMPKSIQTPAQLCSFHMLWRLYSKSFKLGFSSTWTENFPYEQSGFRKGRGTRDQIANICWIIKQEIPEKTSTSSLTTQTPLIVDYNKLWEILKEMGIPPYLSPEKTVCRSRSNCM